MFKERKRDQSSTFRFCVELFFRLQQGEIVYAPPYGESQAEEVTPAPATKRGRVQSGFNPKQRQGVKSGYNRTQRQGVKSGYNRKGRITPSWK